MKTVLTGIALALTLTACGSMGTKTAEVAPKDGELALPDYKAWPVFLVGIQRPDAKQIRDIYINPVGTTAMPGAPFPNGTESVMEIYSVKLNPDGTPMMEDGKLVKDKLSKIFVMAKGENWGASVPAALKNGDWIYSAFDGDGKRAGADMSSCRACHLPLTAKDYVQSYDAYFQKRAALDFAPLAALSRNDLKRVALIVN
jgi:hemoglobin